MCAHRYEDTRLVCCRTDDHDETADCGHVYASSTGSHIDAEPTSDHR